MRDGLDAPTLQLPPEDVHDLRALFDGQSRVKLAVWVRHEQQGVSGPLYDHHLMLGVDDDDWATGEMWALELGLPLPGLRFEQPMWAPDIFPLSEVEALSTFGTVIWEHDPETATGDDPLDFRLTYEPVSVDRNAVARFGALLAVEGGIRRVDATLQRLWKGDGEVERQTSLFVDADGVRHALSIVRDAAQSTGVLTTTTAFSSSLGLPRDPRVRTATLYEATA